MVCVCIYIYTVYIYISKSITSKILPSQASNGGKTKHLGVGGFLGISCCPSFRKMDGSWWSPTASIPGFRGCSCFQPLMEETETIITTAQFWNGSPNWAPIPIRNTWIDDGPNGGEHGGVPSLETTYFWEVEEMKSWKAERAFTTHFFVLNFYPLVNWQLAPENNNVLVETNLPTPICQGLC